MHISVMSKPVRRWVYTLRSTVWGPMFVTALFAFFLALAATRQPALLSGRHGLVRIALFALALGLSFLFDDPAAEMTRAMPTSLLARRFTRSVLIVGPWLFSGALVLIIASSGFERVFRIDLDKPLDPSAFPLDRFVLEAATLAVCSFAFAATASIREAQKPGQTASRAFLAGFALSWLLPPRLAIWTLPSEVRWQAGYLAWSIVGCFACAVAVWVSADMRWPVKTRRRRLDGLSLVQDRVRKADVKQ